MTEVQRYLPADVGSLMSAIFLSITAEALRVSFGPKADLLQLFELVVLLCAFRVRNPAGIAHRRFDHFCFRDSLRSLGATALNPDRPGMARINCAPGFHAGNESDALGPVGSLGCQKGAETLLRMG